MTWAPRPPARRRLHVPPAPPHRAPARPPADSHKNAFRAQSVQLAPEHLGRARWSQCTRRMTEGTGNMDRRLLPRQCAEPTEQLTLSTAAAVISGPWVVAGSSPSPSRSLWTCCTRASTKASCTDSCSAAAVGDLLVAAAASCDAVCRAGADAPAGQHVAQLMCNAHGAARSSRPAQQQHKLQEH